MSDYLTQTFNSHITALKIPFRKRVNILLIGDIAKSPQNPFEKVLQQRYPIKEAAFYYIINTHWAAYFSRILHQTQNLWWISVNFQKWKVYQEILHQGF